MAGKAKTWYLSIVEQATHKSVISSKAFLNVKDMNEFIKEKAEEFPKPEYYIVKENY